VKVVHTLKVRGICPVDQLPDEYTVRVVTRRVIPVEEILAQVEKLTKEPIFQEDLTQKLHRALACTVRSIGYHSGVRTVCTCAA